MVSRALDAFNRGDLNEAVDLALQQVKAHPNDVQHRYLLCEFWCFQGNFERADRQLESMTLQDPSLATTIALFRQLLRAEMARQECWSKGRPPELLSAPCAMIQSMLRAWLARREGDTQEMSDALAEVESHRASPTGSCNGQAIDEFRDLNDLTSFFFETLTSTGKYYWIPFNTIESVTIHAPKRPMELLWCRASMSVRGGPEGDVYLPTIYLDSDKSDNADLRIGRATDWHELSPQATQGVGRRMFLAGETDFSILGLQELHFDPPKPDDPSTAS